jgi:tellurite resistance protein TehA-like permease
MLRYEFISKEWIVSPRARLVYRAAAVASLMLIPLLAEIIIYPQHTFLRPLVFLAVVGMALNGLGMEYFLIRFDNSPAWQQILWFFANILIPVGPALYCFIVYSRSEVVTNSSANSQGSSTSLER